MNFYLYFKIKLLIKKVKNFISRKKKKELHVDILSFQKLTAGNMFSHFGREVQRILKNIAHILTPLVKYC